MLALIDGDILVYRTAFASQGVSEPIARSRMIETLGNILEATKADSYRIFLSDSKSNFRLELFPRYKANRPDEKPEHLYMLQNFVCEKYKAEVAWGQEADDALGINQTEDTVICSIDKDLLQIPGRHYNWVKNEYRRISELEGRHRFYTQVLTGDSGDNITVKEGLSCPGIGPIKAYQALEGEVTEKDYFKTTLDLYYQALKNDFHPEIINKRYLLTARLVKVRQKDGEIWNPPGLYLETD